MKTCCFSGHRNIDESSVILINTLLYEAIYSAIENGYTHFISGFANGVDLMAAAIVIQFKESSKKKPIFLEAAIPYEGIAQKKDPNFQRLLKSCDSVKIISDHYYSGCMHARNKYMIDKSDMLIAVCDGRETGGTKFTIDTAKKQYLDVKVIDL